MATPSTEPATMELPAPVQAVPVPSPPIGPTCTTCGKEAVVHWRRRPTDDELSQLVAAEESRRAEALRLADPRLPEPVFQPLPNGENTTRTVYACASHAITLEGASLIHLSSCSAPNEADLPGCDCTPETPATPDREPEAEPAVSRLPEHWLNGA